MAIQSVSLTLPARKESVAAARAAMAQFATRQGYSDRLGDIELAVSEIVTNSVVHAYRGSRRTGQVHIDAEVNGHLEITVRDTGAGMAPRVDSPGLGMGLAIAVRIADEVRVRAVDGGGSEVVLSFG
jgi:anti-sigma regulatory factor (Ser/Thr protein kinase)